ncbi:MAG TPA: hypothetical protein VF787_20375, partial [Thermoanaerobaculia bacterium]
MTLTETGPAASGTKRIAAPVFCTIVPLLTVHAYDAPAPASGTLTSDPVTVTIGNPPAPQLSITPEPLCPRTNHPTATVVNASAFVEFIWLVSTGSFTGSGATIDILRGDFAGPMWVEVRARTADGCWSEPVRVTVPEAPAPDTTITTADGYCAGSIYEASVPDAGAGATYDWDIANATIVSGEHARIVRFTAGSGANVGVFVEVTGPNGCSNQNLKTVPVTPAMNVSINAPAFVCATAVGQAASATNVAGATYAWTATNATITGGQGTNEITFDVTGSGTVTLDVMVTKGSCASNVASTFAIVNKPSFGIHVSGTTDGQSSYEFCGSGTAGLTATTLDPTWTYAWSTGQNGPHIDVTASGTYTLTATNANGCSSTSSVTITFKPLPQPVISGTTSLCPGGSTTLTASGADSYLWSTGATTASITVTQLGTYSVTATTNGCSASASSVVTENAASIEASGPTTFCAGNSVTLTAAPAQSYAWSNGATTQSITVSASGTYSVVETFANGCVLATSPVNVQVGPSAVSIALDDTSACPGQSITATSSVTGGTNVTYQWLDENGNAIPGATSPTFSIVPSQPGYGHLSLRISDATGCTLTSNTATYYRFDPAPPVITPIGATTFCAGGGVTLQSSSASSYLWSTGATTQSIFVTEAGQYTVTVIDGNGCTTTSASVSVSVFAAARKPVISGTTTFCNGSSTTLTATAGFASYAWSNGMTGASITVSDSATVTVTATNANGCSATSDPYTVTEYAAVTKPVITGATTFCNGGSTTLTATVGFASYSWSNGMTGASITVSDSATVTVTATNANGCSATSDPYTVTEHAVIENPVISGATTFCDGASTTLTASAGFASYVWSNGMTGQSITVSDSATVTVTATNANGCSATSDPYTVAEHAVIENPVIGGATFFCNGTTTTLTASAGFASYAWSNGMTGQSIVVQDTTTVTVTATNAN